MKMATRLAFSGVGCVMPKALTKIWASQSRGFMGDRGTPSRTVYRTAVNPEARPRGGRCRERATWGNRRASTSQCATPVACRCRRGGLH